MKYRLTFTEDLLGVVPSNEEVYKTWIAFKKAALQDEEPPELTEDKSWTVFHLDTKGLYIMDYMVKGFLKEAAAVLAFSSDMRRKGGEPIGEATMRKRVDNLVFVSPRRIYLGKEKPDGFLERPLRAKTMRGDRIALARSDYVDKGTSIEVEIFTLSGCPITDKYIQGWLDYGALKGIGQWRNGSYGRFTWEKIA